VSKQSAATIVALFVLFAGMDPALAAKRDSGRKQRKAEAEDPYAEYVWPPPPDQARIKLETVIRGRADVEAKRGFARRLLGASPQSPYDLLVKPFAVDFDAEGRILVTDSGTSALIRFDVEERRMDVLGTRGNVRLSLPLGVHVAPEGTIYVADADLRAVVAFDPEGRVLRVVGGKEELANPTDVVLSPDGTRLYVADSKAHQVVIFDAASGRKLSTLGEPGDQEGQFAFPTSLAFGPDGSLFVVDQINSRVQMFAADGEYLDQLGGLGVGFGNFVRPKDVAVDEVGFIYVTDNAFNNVQLFDVDFSLLTFVGSGGQTPGTFLGASGIAVQNDRFAVVDQLGRRLQLFRFLLPKEADPENLGAAAVVPVVQREPTEPAPAVTAKVPVPEAAPRAAPPPDQPEKAPAAAVELSPMGATVAGLSEAARNAVLVSQIADLMRGWTAAWAGQRVDEYLAYYAADFAPARGVAREAWIDQRRRCISEPEFIEVSVTGLTVEQVDAARVRASFEQSYRSDTFQDRVRKTLELELLDGAWKIAAERAESL